MYESFFGFRERPFQLTPNPRFLFLNPGHREALATLRYGLASSLGITLLLGEAGTGKTTLLRAALEAERHPGHQVAVLTNPTLTATDFFEILADKFGMPRAASRSKGRFLAAFERDVVERHKAGGVTALIVDEAQSLTHEVFEEIRLLANIETEAAKLVNVILVGQPELADRLNDPTLRQFKQRIVLRCVLAPLDLQSTASYIAARLLVAGGVAAEVFTKEAVRAVYEASHGIPRTIGVICENALLAGFGTEKKPIDQAIISDVCRDLDVPLPEPASLDGARGLSQPPAPTGPPGSGPAPLPRRAAVPFLSSSRREDSDAEPAREDDPAPVAANRRRAFWASLGRNSMRTLLAAALALVVFGEGVALAQAQPPSAPPPRAATPAANKPPAAAPPVALGPGFTIGPEDVLGVVVWRDAEISGDVTVRPDGMITVPLIRDIGAAGLTPGELADRIQEAVREYITDASVTVVVRQMNSRKVFITGEVARPGSYALAAPMTVMQLIAVAGGITEFADAESISVMRLEGGETRTFPFDYKQIAKGRKTEQNILLRPGDTVVVSER